jgi:hypothetical protein
MHGAYPGRGGVEVPKMKVGEQLAYFAELSGLTASTAEVWF